MTNKKLWIKVLAIVAVVCMLSCLFVACKDKENPTKKDPTTTTKPDVMTPLLSGIQKSIASGNMEDFVVSAKLDLGLKNGDATSNYTVGLDLDLNLFDGTNEESNTYVQFEIKEGSDVLLGLYYTDWSEANMGSDAFSSGALYLQAKAGAEQKKLKITAPYVNSTMRALDAKVDFSTVDLSDESIFEGADTILGVINGLLNVNSTTDFSLNLGELLDPENEEGLASLLGGMGETFEELGLDIANSPENQLGAILPQIEITFKPTYATDGALTKLELGLKISDKDIVINKTNNDPLLVVGMNGPIELTAGLTYKIAGGSVSGIKAPTNFDDYVSASLLNVSFDATLNLNKAIAMKIMDGMSIDLPQGNYNLKVRLAAEPTVVLHKLFKYQKVAADAVYSADEWYFKEVVPNKLYERVTATEANFKDFYVRVPQFGFRNLDEILGTIGGILECVEALELVLEETETHAFPLRVIAAKDASSKVLKATVEAGLLNKNDGSDLLGTLNGLEISALLTNIKPIISGLMKAEDAAAKSTLETIGEYLLGVFIGINASAVDSKYPSGIAATVDIAKIPFSGYTEYKGAYNSKYTYYTQTVTYVEQDTTNGFENGVTSFTKDGDVYTPVSDPEGLGPQPGVQYYKENIVYNKATGLTAFADGVKYFVAGSDVETGDAIYGIGLKAELKVNSTDKVLIEATATGLEVFGLPADLKVKIQATGAAMFGYTVPTWQQITAAGYVS